MSIPFHHMASKFLGYVPLPAGLTFAMLFLNLALSLSLALLASNALFLIMLCPFSCNDMRVVL